MEYHQHRIAIMYTLLPLTPSIPHTSYGVSLETLPHLLLHLILRFSPVQLSLHTSFPLRLNILLPHRPNCKLQSACADQPEFHPRHDNPSKSRIRLTMPIILRILLQPSDELIKILLPLLAAFERSPLQFWVVAHEELFFAWGDVVD